MCVCVCARASDALCGVFTTLQTSGKDFSPKSVHLLDLNQPNLVDFSIISSITIITLRGHVLVVIVVDVRFVCIRESARVLTTGATKRACCPRLCNQGRIGHEETPKTRCKKCGRV